MQDWNCKKGACVIIEDMLLYVFTFTINFFYIYKNCQKLSNLFCFLPFFTLFLRTFVTSTTLENNHVLIVDFLLQFLSHHHQYMTVRLDQHLKLLVQDVCYY